LVEVAFVFNVAGLSLSICEHRPWGARRENNCALLVVRQTGSGAEVGGSRPTARNPRIPPRFLERYHDPFLPEIDSGAFLHRPRVFLTTTHSYDQSFTQAYLRRPLRNCVRPQRAWCIWPNASAAGYHHALRFRRESGAS